MDCMAAKALKSSFLSDVCAKSAAGAGQQAFVDDVWCVTGLNNVAAAAASEDFSVDDLLDFSDKEFKDGPLKEQNEEKESNFSDDSSHRNSNFSSFSETDDFGLLLAGELTTPADNLENLEWLSQIVDDTQSEMSLLCPVGVVQDNKKGSFPVKRSEPAVYKVRMAGFPIRVPVKARSKRSRPNGRVWTGSASLTTTESSTTTSSSSYGSTGLSPFVFSSPVHDYDMFFSVEKPAAKKQRRTPSADAGLFGMGLGSTGMLVTRRCSHCQVQKTPQWRTGPMGPKTLCNACGVRYKSGRLFPEYRPACSPTFSQEAHSNSHRKVLEMRRKKETVDHAETGLSGLSAMVPSF